MEGRHLAVGCAAEHHGRRTQPERREIDPESVRVIALRVQAKAPAQRRDRHLPAQRELPAADGDLQVTAGGPAAGPWTIDTDRGDVRDPAGAVALVAAKAASDPGLFEFRRLRIDEGAVARVRGSRPKCGGPISS